MSIASRSLDLTGMFEAEVLVQLLLWRWDHPFLHSPDFRNELLENAATALKAALEGQQIFDELPAAETNLIAAIYYVEWSSLMTGTDDPEGRRQKWLDSFRAAIPSCFHPQADLPPT